MDTSDVKSVANKLVDEVQEKARSKLSQNGAQQPTSTTCDSCLFTFLSPGIYLTFFRGMSFKCNGICEVGNPLLSSIALLIRIVFPRGAVCISRLYSHAVNVYCA